MKSIVIILTIFAIITVFCPTTKSEQLPDNDLYSVLKLTANEVSKSLPMTMNSYTVMDRVYTYGKTFNYAYTITTYPASYYISNPETKKLFIDIMTKQIVNHFCSSPALLKFRENNVTLTHTYSGNDSVFVATISVNNSMCR